MSVTVTCSTCPVDLRTNKCRCDQVANEMKPLDFSEVDSEYLTFEAHRSPSMKTYVVDVLSRSSGTLLGAIRWYGPWRAYVFRPEPDTIYNVGCMDDIKLAITILDQRRSLERSLRA